MTIPLYFASSGPPTASNVLARILVNLLTCGALLVFSVGLRHVIRGAGPAFDRLASLVLGAGLAYVTITLVASSVEAGIVLENPGGGIDPTVDGPLAVLRYGRRRVLQRDRLGQHRADGRPARLLGPGRRGRPAPGRPEGALPGRVAPVQPRRPNTATSSGVRATGRRGGVSAMGRRKEPWRAISRTVPRSASRNPFMVRRASGVSE